MGFKLSRRARNALSPEMKAFRNKIRFGLLSSIFVLLAIATLDNPFKASVASISGHVQTVTPNNPLQTLKSLDAFAPVLSGRRLEGEDACAGVPECEVNGSLCAVDEEREGACCFGVTSENIEEAKECVTIEGLRCPFEDLCVAELVPGSGIGAQCLRSFERKNGSSATGTLLYLFLLMYMFLALAIVCDDYFSYSLDMLGDLMGMSSDVKGATFAAIGSSAPELFVSLADNVISSPPKSVGVGTIVGSAIFNILIIIGFSAIAAGKKYKELQLDWRPLARDSLFYVISIAGLIGVAVTDDSAGWYEGLILLFLYSLYLIFMKYNQRIFDAVDAKLGTGKEKQKVIEDKAVMKAADDMSPTPILDAQEDAAELDETEIQAENKKRRTSIVSKIGKGQLEANQDEENIENTPYFDNLYWPMAEDVGQGTMNRAFGGGMKMQFKRLYYLLVFPINVVFRCSIPDSQYDLFGEDKEDQETGEIIKNQRKIGYWLEFFGCIFYIAILSHFLVFSAAKFGCLVGIAPSVMGLTVLAAGTSVPDAITSIILTNNGEGDAAVANSIGSNVFDILIGLGLPWFLAELVHGEPAAVATGDIGISIGFLFGVLVILLVGLMFTKFKLNTVFGVVLVILYVLYVLFELIIRPNFVSTDE